MKRDLVIVLAPDSFKESMTAKEVCAAMEKGIKKANDKITCIQVPMADGGEGTMQSLVDAAGGLGAGLMAFSNGELKKGIDMVVEYSGLEEKKM